MSVPEVLGCHQIRSRGTFDHVFLDLHVWFPADARLRDAHEVSHVVKDRLLETYPQIADAIIHIEPPPTAMKITQAGLKAQAGLRLGGSRHRPADGLSRQQP